MIKINTKKQAKAFFGSYSKLAKALGITRQAVNKWPARLTERQKNEVLGAAIRKQAQDSPMRRESDYNEHIEE